MGQIQKRRVTCRVVLEQALDAALGNCSGTGPRQVANRGGLTALRPLLCASGQAASMVQVLLPTSLHMLNSGSKATSSLEAAFQFPQLEGASSPAFPKHSMQAFSYQSYQSACVASRTPPIIRLVSASHTESDIENVSLDCIRQVPVPRGRVLHVTIQGSVILHRTEALIQASWVSKSALILPSSRQQTLHIAESYFCHF